MHFSKHIFSLGNVQNNQSESKTIQNKLGFRPSPASDCRCGAGREKPIAAGIYFSPLKLFSPQGGRVGPEKLKRVRIAAFYDKYMFLFFFRFCFPPGPDRSF